MANLYCNRLRELADVLEKLEKEGKYGWIGSGNFYVFNLIKPDPFHGKMYYDLTINVIDREIIVGRKEFSSSITSKMKRFFRCQSKGILWDDYCMRHEFKEYLDPLVCPFRDDEKCPSDKLAEMISSFWPGSKIIYARETRLKTSEDFRKEFADKNRGAKKKNTTRKKKKS